MDTCGRILIEATVISVGEGPYYYPACKQCYSKLIETEDQDDHQIFACLKCSKTYPVSGVNQRYRLCLAVSDGLTLANVTAFGTTLTPYFGCSASELHIKWECLLKGMEYQIDTSVLKWALEQTMVGASLLFGFKGVLQKPKGAQIYLKDLANLRKGSCSQYQGNSTDLIAVQIVPQSKSLYPNPVVQHLQKFGSFIQGQGTCFSSSQFELDSILPALSNNFNLNDSHHTVHDCSLRKENDNKTSHGMDSDVSNSLSGINSEVSVGFSMTFSDEDSNLLGKDESVCNILELRDNAMSGSDLQMSSQKQNCVAKGETPISVGGKSSWCVKKWLKKRYKNCDSSNQSNNLSSLDNSIKSSNFFSPPEQARRQLVDNSPLGGELSPLTFSFTDFVRTPRKHDINFSVNSWKACDRIQPEVFDRYLNDELYIVKNATKEANFNESVASKEHGIQTQSVSVTFSPSPSKGGKNIKKALLTLKSQGITYFGKQISDDQQSDKACGLESGFEETGKDHQVSLLQMPESEDINCFLAAANEELLISDTEHSKAEVSPAGRTALSLAKRNNLDKNADESVRGHEGLNTVSPDDFGTVCDIDKPDVVVGGDYRQGRTKCKLSFLDMPESEDTDLFLFAANVSEMMRREEEESNKEVVNGTRENQIPLDNITKTTDVSRVLLKKVNEESSVATGVLCKCERSVADHQVFFEDVQESNVAVSNFNRDFKNCQTKPGYSAASQKGGEDVESHCDLFLVNDVEGQTKHRPDNDDKLLKNDNVRGLKVHASSFGNVPESEEIDLFLAVTDSEAIQSESNPIASDSKFLHKGGKLTNGGHSFYEIEMDGNCNRLDIYESVNDVLEGSAESIIDTGSTAASCLTRKHPVISGTNHSSDIDSTTNIETCCDNEETFPNPQEFQQRNNDNYDFNNSCDLFCSPIATQRVCRESSIQKDKLLLGDTNTKLNGNNEEGRRELNDSLSLFSFSEDFSPDGEFVVPINPCEIINDSRCVSSTPFHTPPPRLHQRSLGNSCVNFSMDLFSPDSNTPPKLQHNCMKSPNCSSARDISRDLFSSQEMSL